MKKIYLFLMVISVYSKSFSAQGDHQPDQQLVARWNDALDSDNKVALEELFPAQWAEEEGEKILVPQNMLARTKSRETAVFLLDRIQTTIQPAERNNFYNQPHQVGEGENRTRVCPLLHFIDSGWDDLTHRLLQEGGSPYKSNTCSFRTAQGRELGINVFERLLMQGKVTYAKDLEQFMTGHDIPLQHNRIRGAVYNILRAGYTDATYDALKFALENNVCGTRAQINGGVMRQHRRGFSPVHCVIRDSRNYQQTIRFIGLLHAHGANINLPTTEHGYTPLHIAAQIETRAPFEVLAAPIATLIMNQLKALGAQQNILAGPNNNRKTADTLFAERQQLRAERQARRQRNMVLEVLQNEEHGEQARQRLEENIRREMENNPFDAQDVRVALQALLESAQNEQLKQMLEQLLRDIAQEDIQNSDDDTNDSDNEMDSGDE